jgi:hypothetical protein
MVETSIKNQTNLDTWFDDFVANLRTHKVQLETFTASPEILEIYNTLFAGNADEIAHLGKMQVQKHFVTRIVVDYLAMVKNKLPNKLAFDFNDSEVLAWIEINNDDEAMEKELLKAEAMINAKFHPYGFDMETTIVEQRDNLTIPNHYQTLIS